MNLSTIAFRNLGRHKIRSFLSIFAIVIACILGLFMLSLITGMKGDMKKNILSYFTGSVQIRHGEYNKYDYLSPIHLYVENERALREELLKIEGVTDAVGRITAGGKIYIDENNEDDIPGIDFASMVMGIDIPGEATILNPQSLLRKGLLPEMGTRQAVLGVGLAEKAGLDIGDKFSFITKTAGRSPNAMTFEVAGIIQFSMGNLSDSYFLLPLDTMQQFMKMPGGVQEVLVVTVDPEAAEIQQAAIEGFLEGNSSFSHLEATFWKNYGMFYAYMGIGEAFYTVFVLFFLVLGATVIINTTLMVVFERYREIGILGAMGMKPRELMNLFFLEAFFAGVISAVIGISLGAIIILGLEKTGMDFGSAIGSMDMEVSNIIYPDLKLRHVIVMVVYTIGITSLVTLLPSRRAAMIEPDQAIRSN